MAWEYSNSELQVLCADCHDRSHELDTHIKGILARVPPHEVLALLAGYFGTMDDDVAKIVYTEHYDVVELGELASCLRGQTQEFKSKLWGMIVDADMERRR